VSIIVCTLVVIIEGTTDNTISNDNVATCESSGFESVSAAVGGKSRINKNVRGMVFTFFYEYSSTRILFAYGVRRNHERYGNARRGTNYFENRCGILSGTVSKKRRV